MWICDVQKDAVYAATESKHENMDSSVSNDGFFCRELSLRLLYLLLINMILDPPYEVSKPFARNTKIQLVNRSDSAGFKVYRLST